MTSLPVSPFLPIDNLANCFKNIVTSYKFYWFLSILDAIQTRQGGTISLKNLLSGMIANAWPSIRYYGLYLGNSDRLDFITSQIQNITTLQSDSSTKDVFNITLELLTVSPDNEVKEYIYSLATYVPFRFLSPWFKESLKGEKDHRKNDLIKEMAELGFTDHENLCLYRFIDESEECIEIQPDWHHYLKQYHTILRGFCVEHLLEYLQKQNPEIINIQERLLLPTSKNV